MSGLITSVKHKGYELKLYYNDDVLQNPRYYNTNLGKMLCYHPRYNLGDVDYRNENYKTIDELKSMIDSSHLDEKALYGDDLIGYVGLYLYDHSGLSMHTSDNKFNNDRFDNSYIGFYIFTRDDMEEYSDEFIGVSDEELLHAGTEIVEREVKEYNKYLSGDMSEIEYVLEDPEGFVVDSCSGYLIKEGVLTKNVIETIIGDIHIDNYECDIEEFKKVLLDKLLERNV